MGVQGAGSSAEKCVAISVELLLPLGDPRGKVVSGGEEKIGQVAPESLVGGILVHLESPNVDGKRQNPPALASARFFGPTRLALPDCRVHWNLALQTPAWRRIGRETRGITATLPTGRKAARASQKVKRTVHIFRTRRGPAGSRRMYRASTTGKPQRRRRLSSPAQGRSSKPFFGVRRGWLLSSHEQLHVPPAVSTHCPRSSGVPVVVIGAAGTPSP
jgi:hypothetical protein